MVQRQMVVRAQIIRVTQITQKERCLNPLHVTDAVEVIWSHSAQ